MTIRHERATLVTPAEARILHAYGDEFHFHLTSSHTNGGFTLFTDITPPGGGPPPHYHAAEDETFMVLEGRAEFLIDGQWVSLQPDAAIHVPRGIRHTFRNVGKSPLRQLIKISPSGFEKFIEESAVEFCRNGSPNTARLADIAARHGIFFDGLTSANAPRASRATAMSAAHGAISMAPQ